MPSPNPQDTDALGQPMKMDLVSVVSIPVIIRNAMVSQKRAKLVTPSFVITTTSQNTVVQRTIHY